MLAVVILVCGLLIGCNAFYNTDQIEENNNYEKIKIYKRI
jgi:hypothetical protein